MMPVGSDLEAVRNPPLWAVTSYFNPVGWTRRRANYHRFRRSLTVPLVTVELSFGDTFELDEGDADILVRIRGRDVMWQKERLLNLAVAQVPRACDKIAWIDCDVVFADDVWPARAARALDEQALVQLFTERCDLPRDVGPDHPGARDRRASAESVVARILRGAAEPVDLYGADSPIERGSTAGLAWAARRDTLERHGLYDACIIGTGDRAILCAALGEFEHGMRSAAMHEPRRRHYLAWARPFHESIRGRVGNIDGRLYHLWHGDLRDRRYRLRHEQLAAFDFDPVADLSLDENGAWRWNSDKSDMHAFVRRYFAERQEDGG